MNERRPQPKTGWVEVPDPRPFSPDVIRKMDGQTMADSFWRRGPLMVRSSLVIATLPRSDPPTGGPQWLVSCSYQPMIDGQRSSSRCDDRDLRRVRRDFGMREAEEDNHHPGVGRMLFFVVDPAHRVACECKEDDVQVVEPDGFTWSNSRDGACRGCELQRVTGRACPIHAGVTT